MIKEDSLKVILDRADNIRIQNTDVPPSYPQFIDGIPLTKYLTTNKEIEKYFYSSDSALIPRIITVFDHKEDFEEKWQLLNVMVGLLHTDYTEDDLSYIKLGPKCGIGGPGRVIPQPMWEEDSY